MRDMRLKYYLRGLGIGVLVTALILGIAGSGEKPMTDAQIKERARSLGMVDGESLVLSEVRGHEIQEVEKQAEQEQPAEGQPTEEQPAEGQPTEEQPAEEQPAEEQPAEEQPAEEQPAEEQPTEERPTEEQPSEEQPTEERPTEEQPSEEQPTEEQPTEEPEKITFEIRPGASSDSVSRDLEAAGLIGDAGDFDQFLCDNGYSRKLRIGTYDIAIGIKEEEIAKIITGKK